MRFVKYTVLFSLLIGLCGCGLISSNVDGIGKYNEYPDYWHGSPLLEAYTNSEESVLALKYRAFSRKKIVNRWCRIDIPDLSRIKDARITCTGAISEERPVLIDELVTVNLETIPSSAPKETPNTVYSLESAEPQVMLSCFVWKRRSAVNSEVTFDIPTRSINTNPKALKAGLKPAAAVADVVTSPFQIGVGIIGWRIWK